MAFDTEMHNDESQKAHLALGYEKTSCLVQFRKRPA
jgi:hypothetical protein